jgi:hypothetical protein
MKLSQPSPLGLLMYENSEIRLKIKRGTIMSAAISQNRVELKYLSIQGI